MSAGFTGGGLGVVLNGQTWVDVVAAPASGQKQVLSLRFCNEDTVAHVPELRILKNVTARSLPHEFPAIAAGKARELMESCIVLAANDEKLQMRTAEVKTTTDPVVVAAVFEVS